MHIAGRTNIDRALQMNGEMGKYAKRYPAGKAVKKQLIKTHK